jgi:hypothetical protein
MTRLLVLGTVAWLLLSAALGVVVGKAIKAVMR